MTTINTPGLYGAFDFGFSTLRFFNREPMFYPAGFPQASAPAVTTSVTPVRAGTTPSDTASVRVFVPAEAKLTFQGQDTVDTGTQREFVTPPLVAGRTYRYDIQARWNENGREARADRRVYVHAGDRVVVDLTNAVEEGPTLRAQPQTQPQPLPADTPTTGNRSGQENRSGQDNRSGQRAPSAPSDKAGSSGRP